MNKLLAKIEKAKLFRDINTKYILSQITRMNERLLWKGEILANEGDRVDGLYIILSGTLAKQKYSIDGDYVTLNLLERGDCLGEEFFLGHRNRYTYSIEAVTNAEIVYIPRDIILRMKAENSKIEENFNRLISDNINEQYIRVDILSQKNLRMKISNYLLFLHTKSEEVTDYLYGDVLQRSTETTPYVELPVSKEVTAKLLAMPRPSFSRELVRMEKESLIRVNGRIVWLLDLNSLILMGETQDSEEDNL